MTGSSPRMRGAHFHHGFYRVGVGIIPAYAGSTEPSWPRASAWRDHPRVCGEHASSVAHDSVSFGSSPRMRGAPLCVRERQVVHGIIPAYAGSTKMLLTFTTPPRDHPRVCGEHLRARLKPSCRVGSSPRMRGAPNPVSASDLRVRDHPRVCGEHTTGDQGAYRQWGSSPRMRGAPHALAGKGPRAGIIPAYAGSTPCRPA